MRCLLLGSCVLATVLGCGRSNYDTDVGVDALSSCPTVRDEDTLAHYRFEDLGGAVVDDTGIHNGLVSGGAVTTLEGPPGCGNGFQGAADRWLQIDDHPDWQLASGSIDFWVRLPTPPTEDAMGVLSRDADGDVMPGHFSVYYNSEGRMAVRIQGGSGSVCSEVLSVDQWHYIGINFGAGGLEMWINGIRVQSTQAYAFYKGNNLLCTAIGTGGIAGNVNPWVVGARTDSTIEGTASPLDSFFTGGIDELRISSAVREFSGL